MSDQATQQEPAKTAPKPRANPMEQMVLMVAFLGGMIILIDPTARALTGGAVGFVLGPAIGWRDALGGPFVPVLTILLASAVMVLLTSAIRHYFTDYLKQAKAQDVMRAFGREMKSARKENNLHKMKRLTEKNKELMALQAEQSSAQLKPMAITMVVVVPIFAWLLVFVDPGAETASNIPGEAMARVPWDGAWELDTNIGWSVLGFVPRWVALYSLFSIPLGQVVGKALKAYDLRAELAAKGAERA